MQLLDEILKKGFEGDDFMLGLCEHFRNLLFCKDEQTLKMLEVSGNLKQKYAAQSSLASADFLVNCLNLGNQCDVQYKVSKNKRLTVELGLIKMCYVNAVVDMDVAAKKKPTSEGLVETKAKTVNKQADNGVSVPPLETPKEEKPKITEKTTENAAPSAKDAISTKPSASNKQTATLSKTKKMLTADSIQELENGSSENKTLAEETEEQIEGEVLILNHENILKLWAEYGAKIPEEKKGLKMSFTMFKPLWDETAINRIALKVKSDIQRAQFNEVAQGLKRFFSKRLGVPVEFEIIADKEIVDGTKPYTPKEKLERLIQKNPAIKKMQQQLGLELDYD